MQKKLSVIILFVIFRFETRNMEWEMFRRCKLNDSDVTANSGVLIRVRNTNFQSKIYKIFSVEFGGDRNPPG